MARLQKGGLLEAGHAHLVRKVMAAIWPDMTQPPVDPGARPLPFREENQKTPTPKR